LGVEVGGTWKKPPEGLPPGKRGECYGNGMVSGRGRAGAKRGPLPLCGKVRFHKKRAHATAHKLKVSKGASGEGHKKKALQTTKVTFQS